MRHTIAICLVFFAFGFGLTMIFARKRPGRSLALSLVSGACIATAGIVTNDIVLKVIGAVGIILDLRLISRLVAREKIK